MSGAQGEDAQEARTQEARTQEARTQEAGEAEAQEFVTPHVELLVEDGRWCAAELPRLAERAVAAVLDRLGLDGAVVSLLGCDDARIAALNGDFRARLQPTNVLSWPGVEHAPRAPGAWPVLPEAGELGDVAIAWETCTREAAAQGKPLADHVTHLLIHATLHLAGFDHVDPADAETMEETERLILAKLGIPDPYDDEPHER